MKKDREPLVNLIHINAEVGWNCDFRCEDCYRFFDCPSSRREEFYRGSRAQTIEANLHRVKHIVAVMSGKGGVGKSIISANLAVGLANRGYTVAIMDSDLYGPSIPSILGVRKGRFKFGPKGMMPPQASGGIKVASMEFLLKDTSPLTWFSDLKRSAQEQFLANTDYGDLDHLIIDMPPGTGSEAVNLLKYLPHMSGVIIVTIPSDVAEQVVQRSISLCRKARVPIIGLVENLSGLFCPSCGETIVMENCSADILAEELGIPLLGKIARDPVIVDAADKGQSFLIAHPDSEASKNFNEIISRIDEQLGDKGQGYTAEKRLESEKVRLPEVLEINVGQSCYRRNCQSCNHYFQCVLPQKMKLHEGVGFKRIQEAMDSVRHKIAVMSCKGGVGKSTFAANLAVALAQRGRKTTILDCDFHGPCIPQILGVEKAGLKIGRKGIVPASGESNVGVISLGFLLSPGEEVTWFDLLKKTTVAQLLSGVDYGSIDYLIIDLPPGTGAESYGLLQWIPGLDGALVITLPSESPQVVASRSIGLCRQADVRVIGIIENMSYYVCPHCSNVSQLCGTRRTTDLAEKLEVPFLGEVPLDVRISKSCDEGIPFVVRYPKSTASLSVFSIVDALEQLCRGVKLEVRHDT